MSDISNVLYKHIPFLSSTNLCLAYLFVYILIQTANASESVEEPSRYTLPVDIAILGLGAIGYFGVHQIPINIDTARADRY